MKYVLIGLILVLSGCDVCFRPHNIDWPCGEGVYEMRPTIEGLPTYRLSSKISLNDHSVCTDGSWEFTDLITGKRVVSYPSDNKYYDLYKEGKYCHD